VELEPLPERLADELDRLTGMIAGFEADPDDALQARVLELLRSIDYVHRAGLRRLWELLKVAGLEARALDDPETRLLFDLYDLGEGGERERVDAVLAAVRPYIESHGGSLTVVEAEAGVVSIRLSGACSGCQGSTATLRHVVEGALRDGLPEFERMEVVEAPTDGHGHDHAHGAQVPQGFIPLDSLRPVRGPALVWQRVFAASDVAPGMLRRVVVEGVAVIVANVDREFYAYRDGCPGSPLTLESSTVEAGVLTCPWHGCRFDLRGGRRLGSEGPGLPVVPIAVEAGEVRIGSLIGAAA
jgi:Fe-S cluster biogenesis protein NfuA/nitrite reductase/ring-hydroxylating ferredoxin subunit